MYGEVCLWQELYSALFDRNVAGAILTNGDGKILDCNEACARIFGLDSRMDMLHHTAWDFYFDRQDRLNLLHRLRRSIDYPAEEVCLRKADGSSVWVLTMRTTPLRGSNRPECFQATIIDISARKKLEQQLHELEFATGFVSQNGGSNSKELPFSTKVSSLLRALNEALQPANLLNIEKNQIQEIVRTLEALKMLVIELEILRLR
jgi:PAS domain S-box-containing protein